MAPLAEEKELYNSFETSTGKNASMSNVATTLVVYIAGGMECNNTYTHAR